MVLKNSIILRLASSADVKELRFTLLHSLNFWWWGHISRFTAKCSICFARALSIC